jgi:hypothetical protein
VERTDRIDPLPAGERSHLRSEGTEVAEKRGGRKLSQSSKGADVEPLESFQHFFTTLFRDRKRGDGTRSEEAREIPLFYDDRKAGAGGDCRDPRCEESRSPPGSHGGNERTGENLEKSVEDPVHLISRRPIEPLESVHPDLEDPVLLRGLNYWAHVPEDLQDFLDGGRVMRGVRLEEGEGGAEGNGPGNEHPGLDAGLRCPLGHLPKSAAGFQVPRS